MRTVVLEQLSPDERKALLRRSAVPDQDVRTKAADMCRDVAARGADAVEGYARAFGGGFRRITDKEIDDAGGLSFEESSMTRSCMAAIGRSPVSCSRTTKVATAPGSR